MAPSLHMDRRVALRMLHRVADPLHGFLLRTCANFSQNQRMLHDGDSSGVGGDECLLSSPSRGRIPGTMRVSRKRRRFSSDVFVSSLRSREQRIAAIGVRTGALPMIRSCWRLFGERIDRVQLDLDDPSWRFDDGG